MQAPRQPATKRRCGHLAGIAAERMCLASGLRVDSVTVDRSRPRSTRSSGGAVSEEKHEVAVLIADITGSTPLYEQVGDAKALELVAQCLDGLRAALRNEGGLFIRSKGDDVIGAFEDPGAALRAAREMLEQQSDGPLAIHVGIHFGHILRSRGDVFGDAVNLTARVASLARPGEVLATRSYYDRVTEHERRQLRVLDNITFKGKSSPTEIFSMLTEDELTRTAATLGPESGKTRFRYHSGAPQIVVQLRLGDQARNCLDAHSVSIGRSSDCDLVIEQPWVSRHHLTVTVRDGKVQLKDESSLGTYVAIRDGYDFFMRRETVVLTGSGTISPGLRADDKRAEIIDFQITQR